MKHCDQILSLYAQLFSYPEQAYAASIARCQTRLAGIYPWAAAQLEPLSKVAAQGSLKDLEEIYTRTFDMQPHCCPYIGFQLCGESRGRTLFLLKLKEIYLAHNFEEGAELPDHLGVMLRFLSQSADEQEREVIISDGMRPALEKMITAFAEQPEHPYAALLGSLQAFLAHAFSGAAAGRKEVAQ
jgi:nitrate reductase delta subunit